MVFEPEQRKEDKYVNGIQKTLNIGAMSASSRLSYDIEISQPTWQKYLPFDSATIINDSSSDILFYPNMDIDKAIPIPAGVILSTKGSGVVALRSFIITNDSTAITSGQVRIIFEREGMVSDNLSKAVARNVFFKFFFGG